MTTTASLQKARQLYQTADNAGKAMLEKLYPKEKLVIKQIELNTFPAILKAFLKIKFTDTYYQQLQKRKPSDLSAIDRLCIRAEIIRNGYRANYNLANEYKYFPVFEYKDDVSGFVFSNAFFENRLTYSGGRGAVCFPFSGCLGVCYEYPGSDRPFPNHYD